jgi:hypothetical protein
MEPACLIMSLLCKLLDAGFIGIKFSLQSFYWYGNNADFVLDG